MKEKQLQDITALYGRLSRDDEVGGESMSIQSQRAILGQYAKEHGFTNCQFFMDDGYSGTNFDRPAFTEMMELVEQRRVRTIIVKDLSRLGRNYLEVGRYTEVIFPENKVRFIAITDGVDSAAGDNEFAPFKNIINEWYAKDISRKVKSAFKAKALRGEYTARTRRMVMTVTPMTATSSFRISTHGSSRKFFKWRLRVKVAASLQRNWAKSKFSAHRRTCTKSLELLRQILF